MRTLSPDSVDCIITDSPYNGFGFSPEPNQYRKKFAPYLKAMSIFSEAQPERIAISQPPGNLKSISSIFAATNLVTIPDAFADRRGAPVRFLVSNPLDVGTSEPEQWTDLPDAAHPNHRDVNKMAILMKLMSRPGETVLDLFCGSGAIGLACILLGRNYIGIELGRERAEETNSRLLQVSKC